MSPRKPQQNEEIKKKSMEQITRAALQIFSEYGYHGASMDKIAMAASISKGLLYYYFPSKAKIFLHLNKLAFEKSKYIMEKALNTDKTAWEKIEAFSALIVEEVLTKEFAPYFLISLLAMTEGKGIPGILDFISENISHYSDFDLLIIEAQKSGDVVQGDPEMLSAAYLSLVQGLALMMFHDQDLDKKITPEILINLLRNKKG